ncbi:MAG TPA: hypothetical protein VD908_19990 [Cytophagales bacterium]|nr:hypothetical protein [Cytophagales bacterium]
MWFPSSFVIRNSSFCLLFLLSLIIGSCSEKVEPDPPTFSKLLTGDSSKTWRMTSISITVREGNKKYEFSIENDCSDSIDYYDNYYTFYANAERTMEITEGPEKCEFFEELHLVDYWAIENASATLTFVFLPLGGQFRIPWTIKDLTERKLSIEFYTEDGKYIYQSVLNPIEE